MIPDSFQSITHRLGLWVFLAIGCSLFIRCMLLMDSNKRVYNHVPGPCHVIDNLENGSYDLELVEDEVLVTSGSSPSTKGVVQVIAIEGQHVLHSQPLEIRHEFNFDPETFHPTGLSSYTSQGRTSLYIINGDKVEIFLYVKQKRILIHRKTVESPLLSSLSSIVVVGPDRFFVSKLSYFSNYWLKAAELFIHSSLGSLLYYDGRTISVAYSHLPSPSALAIDRDRNLLYVGSFLSENIRIYTIQKDLSLDYKTEISLLSSVSGLFVDSKTGDIWSSLQPVLHEYLAYSRQDSTRRNYSPSQVLRIRIQSDGVSWVITEPYSNDGATISASSSVVFHKDRLLIGSERGKALFCDVINPQIN